MIYGQNPAKESRPVQTDPDGRIVSGGGCYLATATFTRPANTTAYAALDNVGAAAAAFELANIGPAGGQVLVTSADVLGFINAVPSGLSGFYLHLFNATPPSGPADNAAFDVVAGDRASYLGYVELNAPLDVGSTIIAQSDPATHRPFKLAAGVTSLWGVLVTKGAFTPAANSEQYQVRVRTVVL